MIRALKRRVVRGITRFYDPLVTINIGNQAIRIPLSHQLREIMQLYPDYNFNLPRLVSYIEQQQPGLTIIDIGANVGDTVAFIRNYSAAPILCIDGEDGYVKILKQNVAQYKDVSVCHTLVGKETKQVNLSLKAGKGTAYVQEGSKSVPMRTLDDILKDYPVFANSKIIKSDTDGFDTIILRSCEAYLKKNKPVLFFEFDPHLIKRNNDDAFDFFKFLQQNGYTYFMFYSNIGDYMLSCSGDDPDILNELIHYFSGRKLDLFADVCAFTADDQKLFEICRNNEVAYFKKARQY